MALLILFKFYSSLDIWTSNGVHLVYEQDLPTIVNSPETGDHEDEISAYDQTNITIVNEDDASNVKDNSFEEEDPIAESTIISNEENKLTEDQNESTEADRNHIAKKKRKIRIIKQTSKLNKKMKTSCCSFVTDVAVVDVRGKWVNVSD